MQLNNIYAYECVNCLQLFLPPKKICFVCKNIKTTKIKLSGNGKIKTSTVIHIAPNYFATQIPYTIVLVELDEGPRIIGQLKGDQGLSLIDVMVNLKEIDQHGIYIFETV